MTARHLGVFVAGAAAVAMLATACSSSKSSTGTTTPPATTSAGVAATSTAASVKVSVDEGHLVGPNGHVLYANTVDTAASISCTGTCAQAWPPLTGTPTAGSGVTAGMLSTTTRPDGTMQVTYNGHPLYYFARDSGTDDKYGQGVADNGGKWGLVLPAGTLNTAPAPAESSTTSGYSGY
jgi:predicted lipoprotein with Yx(FWY)xxD motif